MIDPSWVTAIGGLLGAGGLGYLLRTALKYLDRERERYFRKREHDRDLEALMKLAEAKTPDDARKLAEAMRVLREIEQHTVLEKPTVQAQHLAVEGVKTPLAIEAAKTDVPPDDRPPKAA